eukprot:gene14043-5022_t
MAQELMPVPGSTQKRQQYNWMPNIKISELLDYAVSKRSYTPSLGSRRPSDRANTDSAVSDQSHQLLLRKSPVNTPWTQSYRGHKKVPSIRQKPASSTLADVEKKLASLVLKHTDDEIYRRNFIEENASSDIANEQTATDNETVNTGVKEQLPLPVVKKQVCQIRTIYKPARQVKYPSKSSRRHRFCLSKYPHSRKNQKRYYVKEADEIQHEVTVDQQGLKEAWEFYVLGKLSDETQCFINHRFDGKEKPKEKLVDFLDAGYRDKDRSDYMMKRKRRLFDMQYKHDEFPGASTHL